MPNWKSYESSVRLLAAIIAAHPGLKLNYDDIGRFYGGGTTYKAVWGRMKQIQEHVKTLKGAIESGIDPITVNLNEAVTSAKAKGQDMAVRFGGDCTKSSLENRFRRIKTDAKMMNDAVAQCIDPITLDIGGPDGVAPIRGGASEIAQCFGSDVSKVAIQNQFWGWVNPNVKAIQAARASGTDCKDIALRLSTGASGKRIQAFFGGDATAGGIRFQFNTRIRNDVEALKDARAHGVDCKDITLPSLGGTEISKYFGSDSTGGGIGFQFRAIKARAKLALDHVDSGGDAKDLGIGSSDKSVASKYGEGASGKAVSTYFERTKKDPQWNLANTIAENGGDSSSRPKSTPRKRATKTKKTSSASDDEDTENMKTPSKTTLNKVASGRVTKKTAPRPASKKVTNYAEPASDEEEDEEMIKGEPHGEPEGFEDINYSNGNGHSHSNGNGYHNNGYSHHHNMHAESYTGAVDDNDNAYFDAEEA